MRMLQIAQALEPDRAGEAGRIAEGSDVVEVLLSHRHPHGVPAIDPALLAARACTENIHAKNQIADVPNYPVFRTRFLG